MSFHSDFLPPLNETLAAPLQQGGGMMTYEQWTAVTVTWPFILTVFIAWAVPIFLYVLVGILARARSSDGRTLSKPMIASPNFYYGLLIFGPISLGMLALVVFPVWLKVVKWFS